MGDCYYTALGIDKHATTEDIKAAFRKQAKLHHPDLNPLGGETAQRKFRELNEAHQVLTDPWKRSQYDAAQSFGSSAPGGGARENARGMTMEEYLKRHVEYWEKARRGMTPDMEARQRREEDAAWRNARMQSWEWEKRDAEMRKGQFTSQYARMETERQARTTRVLSRFWQTRAGVVWQDAAFMCMIGAGMLVSASYWKAWIVAREDRLLAPDGATKLEGSGPHQRGGSIPGARGADDAATPTTLSPTSTAPA